MLSSSAHSAVAFFARLPPVAHTRTVTVESVCALGLFSPINNGSQELSQIYPFLPCTYAVAGGGGGQEGVGLPAGFHELAVSVARARGGGGDAGRDHSRLSGRGNGYYQWRSYHPSASASQKEEGTHTERWLWKESSLSEAKKPLPVKFPPSVCLFRSTLAAAATATAPA